MNDRTKPSAATGSVALLIATRKGAFILRSDPARRAWTTAGPMFFGAVENFERALQEIHADVKILIIRLRRVPFMDITGLQALEEAAHNLKQRGVRVVLCEASPRVRHKLERAGILALLGEGGYFPELGAAIKQA